MYKVLKLRRGTTAQNTAFTGVEGELVYDTQLKQLRVHDGSTVGGKVVGGDSLPSQSGQSGKYLTTDGTSTSWTSISGGVSSVALASGTNNGTLKLTVDGAAQDNVAVTGLGTAAYAASSDFAASSHGHAWANITSTPTSLSGYGITDANITSGVITLGSNTITPITSHQDISGKIDKSTLTTKGDIIYASAASTASRLGIGSTGQVLTVGSSGIPAWQTISSGEGVSFHTEVVSGSAKTTFTVPSTFTKLQVYLNGVLCSPTDTYSVSGQTVTFVEAVPVGDEVSLVMYDGVVRADTVAWSNVTGKPTSLFEVPNTAEAHNCLFRGKEHTVAALSAALADNDFSDIFIGDYIKVSFSCELSTGNVVTIDNMKVLVAAINYYQNAGVTGNHLIMVPEGVFGLDKMASSNDTSGGYKGSRMNNTFMPILGTALKGAIGESHVVSHTITLSSAVTDATPSMAGMGFTGASTSHESTAVNLCLMSEPMVYGGAVFSSSAYDIDERCKQLPLFALNPHLANVNNTWWWLSAVADSTRFACVNNLGRADCRNASFIRGIRPYFVFK